MNARRALRPLVDVYRAGGEDLPWQLRHLEAQLQRLGAKTAGPLARLKQDWDKGFGLAAVLERYGSLPCYTPRTMAHRGPARQPYRFI